MQKICSFPTKILSTWHFSYSILRIICENCRKINRRATILSVSQCNGSFIGVALRRIRSVLAGRPGLQPLVSIRNQLIYLRQVCAGTAGPERLAEIILGVLAVREIEGWDDELAELLHRISAAVGRLKAAD